MAPPALVPPKRNQTPLILGIIAAVVVVAVVLFVVRPFGASTVTGTWYGTGITNAGGESLSIGTYLNLAQNGQQISGSGETCYRVNAEVKSFSFTVSGTTNGSALDMTWRDETQNDSLHVTGQLSGSQLTVAYNGTDGSYNDTLHAASHDDYQAACVNI